MLWIARGEDVLLSKAGVVVAVSPPESTMASTWSPGEKSGVKIVSASSRAGGRILVNATKTLLRALSPDSAILQSKCLDHEVRLHSQVGQQNVERSTVFY